MGFDADPGVEGRTGGLELPPLLWEEFVTMVVRDEGMLELLLWVLLPGDTRRRGVEKRWSALGLNRLDWSGDQ